MPEERDDRGNGILRCNICGEPYRDHDTIGPCPEVGELGRVLRVPLDRAMIAHAGASACGDKYGTDAGYHRHNRNREKPCEPCRKAHAERSRRDYERKKEKANA